MRHRHQNNLYHLFNIQILVFDPGPIDSESMEMGFRECIFQTLDDTRVYPWVRKTTQF